VKREQLKDNTPTPEPPQEHRAQAIECKPKTARRISRLATSVRQGKLCLVTKVIQNPPTPPSGAQLWPLSVAAYRALGDAGLIPENTELLYGFVYTKMSKSPYHSFLLQFLHEILSGCLPAGHLLRTEQPITCGDSEPEPDLAVVAGRNESFRNDHPRTAEIIIEICITSHDYDRSKLRAYADAQVKECWFILGPEKQIEVFRLPGNGRFAEHMVHGPGGTLTSAALPGLALSLDTLFAG
jgi:Uma2 family endonuclease